MPCYDSEASEERVKAYDTQALEREQLIKRVAWLEAALCGTQKALFASNASKLFPLDLIDFKEMGIKKSEYYHDYRNHCLLDKLKRIPK